MLNFQELACQEGETGWYLVVEYLYYNDAKAINGELCPEQANNEFATGWPNGDGSYYRITAMEEDPERRVQKFKLSEAPPNAVWQLSRQEDIVDEDIRVEPKPRLVLQYATKTIDGQETEELAYTRNYYHFARESGCRNQEIIWQLHQPPVLIDYRFVYCGKVCPPGYVECPCKDKVCCYSCREVVRYLLKIGPLPTKFCPGEEQPTELQPDKLQCKDCELDWCDLTLLLLEKRRIL